MTTNECGAIHDDGHTCTLESGHEGMHFAADTGGKWQDEPEGAGATTETTSAAVSLTQDEWQELCEFLGAVGQDGKAYGVDDVIAGVLRAKLERIARDPKVAEELARGDGPQPEEIKG